MAHKAKILGIWINSDRSEEASYNLNFKEPLNKIKSVCESWANRNLTLKGKVTIANSLLISTLQYPCSIIHTPIRVCKEYRRVIAQFLWDDRRPKISYVSITQPISRGGLNLFDLEIRIKVSYLKWIRRLTSHFPMNITASLMDKLQTDDITQFFRSKHSSHYKIRQYDNRSLNNFRREPIWSNGVITWNIPST